MAREIIYTGRNVKAGEAKDIGLVNKVVPVKSLMQEALDIVMKVIVSTGIAIRYAKIAINRGMDTDIYKAMELAKDLIVPCFAIDDQKEGCKAFLEERSAKFKY